MCSGTRGPVGSVIALGAPPRARAGVPLTPVISRRPPHDAFGSENGCHAVEAQSTDPPQRDIELWRNYCRPACQHRRYLGNRADDKRTGLSAACGRLSMESEHPSCAEEPIVNLVNRVPLSPVVFHDFAATERRVGFAASWCSRSSDCRCIQSRNMQWRKTSGCSGPNTWRFGGPGEPPRK